MAGAYTKVPASTRLSAPSFIAHTLALIEADGRRRTCVVLDVAAVARAHKRIEKHDVVNDTVAAEIRLQLFAVLDAPGSVPGWNLERLPGKKLRVQCTRRREAGVFELVLAAAAVL